MPKNMKPRPLALLLFATLLFMAARQAAAAASNLDLARQLNQAFVELAEKVSPSVVVLTVIQKPSTVALDALEDNSDGAAPLEKILGQGSGLIIRTNGYILTNCHVVEDAEKIEVRLHDGRRFKAVVRGVDSRSDLAVIKIEATGLPAARLANSANTRVGEFAIAIGAPLQLDYSVTFGHVSAKGRSRIFYDPNADQDFIQTDASINPGNSGGPLVNIDGEVIGINTLIRGMHTGIGFAIPSDLAREVSEHLITDGKFTRAWLGVSIQGLKDDPENLNRIKGVQDGVLIQAILRGGPAAKSDLAIGDVITTVDGHRVSTVQELRNEIRGKKIGQPVALDVFRNDKIITLKVSPGEWVEPEATFAARFPARRSPADKLGLTVAPLTADTAKKFAVPMTDGVIVTRITDDSSAARASLRPGDVITSVDGEDTRSVGQFREALQYANLKKGVRLNFLRGEQKLSELLKLGQE